MKMTIKEAYSEACEMQGNLTDAVFTNTLLVMLIDAIAPSSAAKVPHDEACQSCGGWLGHKAIGTAAICINCAKPKSVPGPLTAGTERTDFNVREVFAAQLDVAREDRDAANSRAFAAEKRVKELEEDTKGAIERASEMAAPWLKRAELAERRLEIAREFIENAAKYSDEYPTKDRASATLKRIDGEGSESYPKGLKHSDITGVANE